MQAHTIRSQESAAGRPQALAARSDQAVWYALLALLAAAFTAALCLGRITVSPVAMWGWIAGTDAPAGTPLATAQTVLGVLRLPRALLAILLGAGLGMAGAVLQGVLRNPLAGPQNVGVLAGAGAGGTLALLFWGHPAVVTGAAFAGGLLAIAGVLWLARVEGQITALSLILAGIVVSSLLTALIAVAQFTADPERQLPNLVFWLMGSLATASPARVLIAALCIVPAGIALWCVASRLDVLASGDDEARSLGVNPAVVRSSALTAVALICSGVVACAGLIGWIGLVVPHMARPLVGAGQRALMPASAIIGAVVLLVVDTLCRSATAAEIPLGAVTAVLGAPLFAVLLKRQLVANYH